MFGFSKKSSPKKMQGVGGAVIYGTQLQDGERSPELSGNRKYKTYSDNLANVAIVAAGVRYFLRTLAGANWIFEAADESQEALDYAQKTEDILHDMETPWHRVVRRAGAYVFWGFSIQEWASKVREDGSIGFADIAPRPQSTIWGWKLDDNGRLEYVEQQDPNTFEIKQIDRWKIIYVVDDSLNDSPEGLGLFRHVAATAKVLKRYQQLEGYGYESDLAGVPVIRAPYAEMDDMINEGEMSAEGKAAALKPLTDFIQNRIKNPQLGLALDSQTYATDAESPSITGVYKWDVEIIKGGSQGFKEIADAINRLTMDLALILGCEGLLVGINGRGAQSLSEDKSRTFAVMVDSALKELAETFKKDIIDRLWILNGWPDDMKPKLKPEPAKNRDVKDIFAAISDLASAGVPLTREDEAVNELMDALGLSGLDPDDIPPITDTGAEMPTSFNIDEVQNGADTRNQ